MLICAFILGFIILFAIGTVDINLPEYEYLSDKLRPEECRQLIAALHFTSYQEPNAIEQSERKVPKELTCLQMLLHWNSAKGEGRGETHEVVQNRLRQIGRQDLAEWLAKTVFHQLSVELNRSIDKPFDELENNTEKATIYAQQPTLFPPLEIDDVTLWTPFDTISTTLLLIIGVILIGAFVKLIWRSSCTSKVRTCKCSEEKSYIQVQSESESEPDNYNSYE